MTSVREAYDAWHAAHAGDAVDTPWHGMVLAALAEASPAGARVLEIGCGRGAFAHWLAAAPFAPAMIAAADYSPRAVAIAQATAPAGGARIGWLTADLQRLPFADRTFDLAISCETIEHVPSPRAGLAELARVLRPGGRLILTCPSYLNATGLFRIYLRMVGRRYDEGGQPIAHPLLLPATVRWVRSAGFAVVRVRGIGHYLPFPGRAPMRAHALDALLPQAAAKWFALHTCIEAIRA